MQIQTNQELGDNENSDRKRIDDGVEHEIAVREYQSAIKAFEKKIREFEQIDEEFLQAKRKFVGGKKETDGKTDLSI